MIEWKSKYATFYQGPTTSKASNMGIFTEEWQAYPSSFVTVFPSIYHFSYSCKKEESKMKDIKQNWEGWGEKK